jgi:hypothetical protein
VRMFGMQYVPINGELIPKRGQDGRYIEYDYHYDPADISRGSLFFSGSFIADVYAKELRQADGTHRPCSIIERKLAHELAVAAGSAPGSWFAFLDEVHETAATREQEKRKARSLQRPSSAAVEKRGSKRLKPALSIIRSDNDGQTDSLRTQLLKGFGTSA